MKEYHKIETLYERELTGSKKLIEGKFRNETVEFLKDNQWIFTEKIDGTNIRIHWDGHRVSFGGRTERAAIPADLMNYLIATFGGEDAEQVFEQKFGETEVTLYGEGYGPKIQAVGAKYRADVSFILFDVLINDMWLTRDSVVDIAKAFGIDVVPIVLIGTLEEAVALMKQKPLSVLGPIMMEGVVGRPGVEVLDRRGRRVIVKIKARDFG